MTDYCKEAVSLYLDVAGPKINLRKVSTPYVSEGILNQQDYEVTGEIAMKASSVLMKLLWVCRLCRPDLAFCISMLAGQVSKWNRNCETIVQTCVVIEFNAQPLHAHQSI